MRLKGLRIALSFSGKSISTGEMSAGDAQGKTRAIAPLALVDPWLVLTGRVGSRACRVLGDTAVRTTGFDCR